MKIPDAIFETRQELTQVIINGGDFPQHRLCIRAKACLDWLLEHLRATDAAYQQVRCERLEED
mgnify:FL=1